MLNSLKRILTIFKKDLKDSLIIIGALILIPLCAYYVPIMFSDKNNKVCIVYSDVNKSALGFKEKNVVYEVSNIKAMKLLNDKKVEAVINIEEKEVSTYSKDPLVLSELKRGVSNVDKSSMKINIVNGESSEKAYNAFLCAMLIMLVGVIGGPLLFISESKNDTMSALLLSPLSYIELILSKSLISFVSVVVALYTFLFIIGQYNTNIIAVLSLVVVIALFTTVLSAIISLPFKTEEQMMILTTPLSLVIVIAETLSYEMGYVEYLPIQSGFKDIFLYNKFPVMQIFMLSGVAIILFAIYMYLFRKIKRL
jgi:hypothetical protein